jgi:hypothetical protein
MFTPREQSEFKAFLNYRKIPNVENSSKFHAVAVSVTVVNCFFTTSLIRSISAKLIPA